MAFVFTIIYAILMSVIGLYLYRSVGLAVHAQLEKWEPVAVAAGDNLPVVTVQLPLHNEKSVVSRLLQAVCKLDYPRERLEIQVLDDSTDDDTSTLIMAEMERWQKADAPIVYLRRGTNEGYKAGNLEYGLEQARGEFIAIFDADFVPAAGWLRQAVAHFLEQGNDDLGLVQTRWAHLNADESLLTYAETQRMDQFAITQATRTRLGLWSTFYGSAGLWRRVCIEEAGGWSTATLTEDLDLAYRAQLAGWRLGFENVELAAAELPGQIGAYKRQQFRWAKGNMQVMRGLWKQMLASPLSALSRLDAFLFATWPVIHILIVLMLLVRFVMLWWPDRVFLYLDGIVTLGIAGMFIPVVIAGLQGQRYFPLHIVLGAGISVNNAGGMLAGLLGSKGGVFHATPKGGEAQSLMRPDLHWSTIGEVALALLSLFGLIKSGRANQWLAMPFFILCAAGLSWIASLSIIEFIQSLLYRRRQDSG